MKKKVTIDGNEACTYNAYMFTEVAGIYPITPSSPMAEQMDSWSNDGRLNLFNDTVKVVEMQSEAGAAGMVHGSLQAGLLTTTFTSSQGLLLMIPNIYKMAGEMLPGVLHVAARSISTQALSIFGDHQDIYATRQTGITMMSSSSVQDTAYLSAIAHLVAIKSSLPFMHFFDGFRTSHELQKIDVLDIEDYRSLIDYDALSKFRKNALQPNKTITRGTAQNDDIYFQAMEVRNKFHDEVPNIVNDYMQKINELAGTNYKPFNYYGSDNAENIIVAMGSVTETIKETIDYLNNQNYNVGLIEVHLYRPFSTKYLLDVIPNTVKQIAVLDRTKEPGSLGEPLYLDIVASLKGKDIKIVGGRYGLSSKNTTPRQIKAVYDMLASKPKNNFTIGIVDDVTNLSLEVDPNFKITNASEFTIYGYGSDGMVTAAKSIIKIIGDKTDKYVQGYFQYDSKKSGGVTLGHLRFCDNPIRATYYTENPQLVVVTKDSYLDDFKVIYNIANDGIFILATSKTEDEVQKLLTIDMKNIIEERNIKFYIINAYELARKVGLQNRISTIMQMAILKVTNIIDYEMAKKETKEIVKRVFSYKGDEVVKANFDAIDGVDEYLKEVTINFENSHKKLNNVFDGVFEVMSRREGDQLPTSAFLNYPNGTFDGGTSKMEKRAISDIVPSWISENCIQCTQCSFVCPHAVIRPFHLSEEEYQMAPDYVKTRCVKPIEKKLEDYYYIISVSVKDCTGCRLCINVCPGKGGQKALVPKDLTGEIKNKEQDIADYLFNNISEKNVLPTTTIKGTQLKEPKFSFHGACAGCGETAYIKLLTQLFGDRMMIANATGCSSIYGASAPSMPYDIPWASSLFEDNAEYGYGMLVASNVMRNRVRKVMEDNLNNSNKELFEKWLANSNDFDITKEVYENINYSDAPKELVELKEYIKSRTIWTIGGDGWAYDIGFGGIDHVLASNDNVNILVLDSQVYSNTGGQSSKSSPRGSVAPFTASGKQVARKDLARIALSYPHVYVAQVSLAANPMQLIKTFNEAAAYNGPSIIIAYTPCIAHGIKGGMSNTLENEKDATKSGYFPIFRYNPITEEFTLDSKNVDFDLYEDFLNSQTRFTLLKKLNPDEAEKLLENQKLDSMKRYEYYKKLSEKAIE
ncbi:MAG: pyruvate:ferredoxin (flavodoxin) oxidoreductase [Bacilli bacterium]|nr:pyruvate:ferredoxin (flavodoxin) oxidoreductase [Bacilli bacterium]